MLGTRAAKSDYLIFVRSFVCACVFCSWELYECRWCSYWLRVILSTGSSRYAPEWIALVNKGYVVEEKNSCLPALSSVLHCIAFLPILSKSQQNFLDLFISVQASIRFTSCHRCFYVIFWILIPKWKTSNSPCSVDCLVYTLRLVWSLTILSQVSNFFFLILCWRNWKQWSLR